MVQKVSERSKPGERDAESAASARSAADKAKAEGGASLPGESHAKAATLSTSPSEDNASSEVTAPSATPPHATNTPQKTKAKDQSEVARKKKIETRSDGKPALRSNDGRPNSEAPAAKAGSASATAVGPAASPARWRSRHRNLLLSVIVVVLLPVFLSAGYLGFLAQDQYASTTGFTIRQGETETASELLGGLTQMIGGGTAGNADLLFEFLQSQEVVERIDARLDLRAHYSASWPSDPVYAIWPGATIEDLLRFWRRMVRVNYNKASGLIVIEVRARDAATAQQIAGLIVAESESMINMLNEAARRDGMANAEADLNEALERLRVAREEMVEFRARTQILDPMADIQGRMGVLNNLQQQLAQALVDYDLLLHTAETGDPRLRSGLRRIEVIRDRIAEERRSFAAQDVTVDNTDYPQLLAQYEGLRVTQEFTEQSYRAALTAYDVARSHAERQQLYLATFIRPTLAQRSEYPQRLLLVGLTALFAGMIWSILALVYYSLRDRG